MKVVVNPNEKISKTWGAPNVKESDYRLIIYHLRAECEDGGTLLHNNVTGEMLHLSPDEATVLDSPTIAGDVNNELISTLVAKHFLVPVDFDEHKSVNQLRKTLRIIDRPKNIIGYVILPTTACNARCFYCYEAGYPHHTMTEEIAHKTVEYIAKHCGEKKKVSLSWFGGEPLVGQQRISQICRELKEIGIEYHSSMISNGYLFTKELVQTAKDDWKLTSIQITLDGTEEIYNKVKAYVNVKDNPYTRVLDNIGYLLDSEIRVSVRMNLDRHNAENLKDLINELAERFGGNKHFSAYVHILFDDCGFTPVEHTENDNNELMDIQNKLTDIIIEKKIGNGKHFSLPMLKEFYCMADNFGSRLINPLGQLTKCEHWAYEHIVGDIENDITDMNEKAFWEQHNEWDKCISCPLYPQCFIPKGCQTQTACVDSKILYETENIKEKMKKVYLHKKENDENREVKADENIYESRT